MKNQKKKFALEQLTLGAMLTALVVVLQLVSTFIKFGPFSITLTLIPIAIGAICCGPKMGAWLGLVFGIIVLTGPDCAAYFAISVPFTVITVILKGMFSGLVAGIVYKLLEKYNKTVAAVASSILVPIVNTGVFILGSVVFFSGVFEQLILIVISSNFLFEFSITVVLSPVVVRLIKLPQVQKVLGK